MITASSDGSRLWLQHFWALVCVMAVVPLFASAAPAQLPIPNYCAFAVVVSTPGGLPVRGVPVAMILADKMVFSETKTLTGGTAMLCDAPVEPVDIVVGFDICGSVVVRKVRANWRETWTIHVTYEKTFCDHLAVTGKCSVVIRLQDEAGSPLAGAQFEPRPASSARRVFMSDGLGRVFFSSSIGETITGTITLKGYRPVSFSDVCSDDIDRKVVLRRDEH